MMQPDGFWKKSPSSTNNTKGNHTKLASIGRKAEDEQLPTHTIPQQTKQMFLLREKWQAPPTILHRNRQELPTMLSRKWPTLQTLPTRKICNRPPRLVATAALPSSEEIGNDVDSFPGKLDVKVVTTMKETVTRMIVASTMDQDDSDMEFCIEFALESLQEKRSGNSR
jgi:hypothetical protein